MASYNKTVDARPVTTNPLAEWGEPWTIIRTVAGSNLGRGVCSLQVSLFSFFERISFWFSCIWTWIVLLSPLIECKISYYRISRLLFFRSLGGTSICVSMLQLVTFGSLRMQHLRQAQLFHYCLYFAVSVLLLHYNLVLTNIILECLLGYRY